MARHNCPSCGHTFTDAPKRRAAVSTEPVDTSTMTDAELYAHYRRVAHVEDARFFLRTRLSLDPNIRQAVEALIEMNPPRPEFLRELNAIKTEYWKAKPWRSMAETIDEPLAMAA